MRTSSGLTAQHRSGGFKQPKLSQCSHAIIETDLLSDLSIDHLQHRGAGEMHLAPGRCRQAADQEILFSLKTLLVRYPVTIIENRR